jgi:hypothetical protein
VEFVADITCHGYPTVIAKIQKTLPKKKVTTDKATSTNDLLFPQDSQCTVLQDIYTFLM